MGFVDGNGNSLINEEQKVRIPLSERASIIIAEDMDVFGVPKTATFLNTILDNFHDDAKSSVSLYLQERKLELDDLFRNTQLNDSAKDIAINQILQSEKKTILTNISEYRLSNASNKLYHINNTNVQYLTNDCEEQDNYDRPGQYIRSLIEEYCSLPFIKRERIFRKQVYDKIEQACKDRRILKVIANYMGKDQLFYVYPYKIVPDPFHTQSYLVCYSRKDTDEEKDKVIASFSMARIKMPTILRKTFYLNQTEIDDLESSFTKNSPAYLVGKPELVRVRLTTKGRLSYQTRLYTRPEKIASLSTDDVYVFNCTAQQIFNYFFSFGSDAEIISPEGLRNRFKNTYEKGLKNYT